MKCLPRVLAASRPTGRANLAGYLTGAAPRVASGFTVASGFARAGRSPDGLIAAILEWKRTRSRQAAIDEVVAAVAKAPAPEPLSVRDEQLLALP